MMMGPFTTRTVTTQDYTVTATGESFLLFLSMVNALATAASATANAARAAAAASAESVLMSPEQPLLQRRPPQSQTQRPAGAAAHHGAVTVTTP